MIAMTDAGITTSLVADLVAAQFPAWAGLPLRELTGGFDNRTFRLGDELTVRLPSGQAHAAQVDKEHRWLPVLAPHLPVPIPESIARGEPSDLFPWPWSVRRWLPGELASRVRDDDLVAFASDVAGFLSCLAGIGPAGGPPPGAHNFYRGGSLSVYDAQTRDRIAYLGTRIDGGRATAVWDAAMATNWDRPPVWIHGDVTPANMLAERGRLSAVLDFGGCAVGDPACDLAIAWTAFTGRSRDTFGAELALDEGTWDRARGWALWKALNTMYPGPVAAEEARIAFGWRWPVDAVLGQILALSAAKRGLHHVGHQLE
jgi:aminoglycoside phosphotransferase (APT) family kinase protein